MIVFLALALATACNSNGAPDGPGDGNGPPGGAVDSDKGLPPIGGPSDLDESQKRYYIDSRSIYLAGNPAAWEVRRTEILATKGHAGQEFLIVLLGLAEQDPERDAVHQEVARAELSKVLRDIAASGDDWGCWYFMHMFLRGDMVFANSSFVPTCIQTGKPLYPYVRRLINEGDLKEIQLGSVYQALGGAGRDLAVADLAHFYDRHSGPDGSILRASCMTGLGLAASESAIDALSKGLDDPDSFVREEAIKGLTCIGSAKAVPALIKALKMSKKFREKNAILERLRQIAGDKGKKIGDTPAAWEEWWRSNGGRQG